MTPVEREGSRSNRCGHRRAGRTRLGRGLDRRPARARENPGDAAGQGNLVVRPDQPGFGLPPQRTLSGLTALVQSSALKAALQPYTVEGPFGHLLDAETDRMSEADVVAFEMKS